MDTFILVIGVLCFGVFVLFGFIGAIAMVYLANDMILFWIERRKERRGAK